LPDCVAAGLLVAASAAFNGMNAKRTRTMLVDIAIFMTGLSATPAFPQKTIR
jgi:hypothetical protein